MPCPESPESPESALPLCVIVPEGLQAMLMFSGLIRHLAEGSPVLLCTRHEHMPTVRRLFGDLDLRFWFDKESPAAAARAMGMDVMVVPNSPVRAYASVGLMPIDMHRLFVAHRNEAREEAVLKAVVDANGSTFVAMHGDIDRALLPEGVPVVDVAMVAIEEPLDLCGVLNRAMQVHASDGWVLTLADLVSGASRKFCHVYASKATLDGCRKKYRKRVTILARRGSSVSCLEK